MILGATSTGGPTTGGKSLDRRDSIHRSYQNAACWGLGNGLVSSTLVIYLVYEFLASESDADRNLAIAVALILAVPKFIGLLRLSAPAMIDRLASRKKFCIACYASSAVLLATLPVIAAPGVWATPRTSLVVLVAIWSSYHLLEYLATVALWSWLADLVPRNVRGTFIGYRQRWMLAGNVVGMICTGLFTYAWKTRMLGDDVWLDAAIAADSWVREAWVGYAISAVAGSLVLLFAVWPLSKMRDIRSCGQRAPQLSLRELLAPLRDGRYWRLLFFGCSLAFFNGLTQSIQFLYPLQVLGVPLLAFLCLRSVMRVGQISISPAIGRLADRFGNRPVMIACQLIVATGPAFYLLATPEQPWWFAMAWLAWIAYAGLNVCLPNLMIKLATSEQRAAYIATYFAVTGIAYGLSTVAGAWIASKYATWSYASTFFGTSIDWNITELMLFIGWCGRSACVLLLFWIIEPGAKSVRQMLRVESD